MFICYCYSDGCVNLSCDSFKFLLSPLTSVTEQCLYDPDAIVPWQNIACVILPSPVSHEANNDNERTGDESVSPHDALLMCPICLDSAQIPKITSCGHVFW